MSWRSEQDLTQAKTWPSHYSPKRPNFIDNHVVIFRMKRWVLVEDCFNVNLTIIIAVGG
jgi:hypothetical protein